MAQVVRFYETGEPEVLRFERADIPPPGPSEVRVRHVAVGVNFNDIYQRRGVYPVQLPAGIGREGAGIVEELGPGVTGFSVGDRVTYTSSPLGAYSTERIIDSKYLIKLPDAIALETAAAMTMRGLTAAYLLRRIYAWQPGDALLMHAAAGGVGLIVCQWAKLLGLTVIGTVSTPEKAAVALAHGCDHVIVRSAEDTCERVLQLTDGQGVAAVFDGIGQQTYEASLGSLKRRGLLVALGTASGPFPPIHAMQLARGGGGSLFFTRPALADYTADDSEKKQLASELFSHVAEGQIRVQINRSFKLSEAVEAHRELESGTSIGSSVLLT